MSDRKNINLLLKPSVSLSLEEVKELHQISHLMTQDVKVQVGLVIPVDVFVQNPYVVKSALRSADPHISKHPEWEPLRQIYVPCEPDLLPGPTSSRIAVVDYDADTNKLEVPVAWDHAHRRFYFNYKKDKVWLSIDHYDTPQFHQVSVWATVMGILSEYENSFILGHSIPWAFEGNRIILIPHAGNAPDARYDRKSKSIKFYYFYNNDEKIFTCLSPDIVTYQTSQAILDGLRPLYQEKTSLQTAAFHVFIANLTAILTTLRNNELRFDMPEESTVDLHHDQLISSLAEEYGYYSYGNPILRTAQNTMTMLDVKGETDVYAVSQVLTGAMFDILKEFLAIRMIASRSDMHMPSIKQGFYFALNKFRQIALQPLDYLPPVDVQFDDYVQAVLRADEISSPMDEYGYRAAMKKVFQLRGFILDQDDSQNGKRLFLSEIDISRISRSKTDAYHFLNENRRQLCIPMEQDFSVIDVYHTDKTSMRAKLPREIVIQYVWREDVEIKGKNFGSLEGEYMPLMCGGTLVIDSRGNILSWQRKPGAGNIERGPRLRTYCRDEQEIGIQRREQLLSYLEWLISNGDLGIEKVNRPADFDFQQPLEVRRGVDGSIRLKATPYLRHWAEDS